MTAKEQVMSIDHEATCRYLRQRGEDNRVYVATYTREDGRCTSSPAQRTAQAAWAWALEDLSPAAAEARWERACDAARTHF